MINNNYRNYRTTSTDDVYRPRAKQIRFTPNKIYDLLNNILKQFECPLCHEYMYHNIIECNAGHSFCKDCTKKCNGICPICNDKIVNVRNFSLESAAACVERRCKWAKDGCSANPIKLTEWKDHVEDCEYADVTCPLKEEAKCVWHGKAKDVVEHLKEGHEVELNILNSYRTCEGNSKNNYYYVSIISYFNKLFKLYEIHKLKSLNRGHNITWLAKYIGSKKRAEDFIFVINFVNSTDPRFNMLGSAVCVPYDELINNVKNSYSVTAKDVEDFHYTVKILSKSNYDKWYIKAANSKKENKKENDTKQ